MKAGRAIRITPQTAPTMCRTVSAIGERFALDRPFRIARGVKTAIDVITVTITEAGITGRGEGVPLSARDRWIAAQVAPELRRRGLRFVGLDVIGDWLTEVNVTSPTCARELDAQFGLNIAGLLFDAIEAGPAPVDDRT